MITPYIIDASPRFRSMTLMVRPDGIPCVRVPRSHDPDIVDRFVRSYERWIEEQRRVLAIPDNLPGHNIQAGDRMIRCTITCQARRKKPAILVHQDGQVDVRVPEGMGADQVIPLIEQYKDEIRKKLDGEQPPVSNDRSVTWNSTVIPYMIRTSTRARRIAIRVLADRSVEVVAPAAAKSSDIERVVSEKAEWIYRQVTTDARPVAARRKFSDGESYPFLDRTLTVRVTWGAGKATAIREGPFIMVRLPDGISARHEQAYVRQAVEFTMKDETEKAVAPILPRYAALFGLAAPPFSVRAAQRRWGSCIGKNRLTFSSHLCMLPPRLFHYVIAHEVCHLLVMDHSPRYWETFKKVMPDCRERAAELRRDTPLYQIM